MKADIPIVTIFGAVAAPAVQTLAELHAIPGDVFIACVMGSLVSVWIRWRGKQLAGAVALATSFLIGSVAGYWLHPLLAGWLGFDGAVGASAFVMSLAGSQVVDFLVDCGPYIKRIADKLTERGGE